MVRANAAATWAPSLIEERVDREVLLRALSQAKVSIDWPIRRLLIIEKDEAQCRYIETLLNGLISRLKGSTAGRKRSGPSASPASTVRSSISTCRKLPVSNSSSACVGLTMAAL